jgi:hypothetical protein
LATESPLVFADQSGADEPAVAGDKDSFLLHDLRQNRTQGL